jgi:hypothetical protein
MGEVHQEHVVGAANSTAIVNNNENEQITAVMARRRTVSLHHQRACWIAQAGDRGTIREFQFHESTDLRGRVKRHDCWILAQSVGWVELIRAFTA